MNKSVLIIIYLMQTEYLEDMLYKPLDRKVNNKWVSPLMDSQSNARIEGQL